jgi:hypothetical protein
MRSQCHWHWLLLGIQMPPQLRYPLLHAASQAPPLQTGVPCRTAGQTMPQSPQLFGSVARSLQAPLAGQYVRGPHWGGQVVLQSPVSGQYVKPLAHTQTFVPPQVQFAGQFPQDNVPPQPSDRGPQFLPCAVHVVGVQQTFHVVQIWPALLLQAPHARVPPQPSDTDPQFVPNCAQVSGAQLTGFCSLMLPMVS